MPDRDPIVPSNDWTDDDFKAAVQAGQDAMRRPLTAEGVESFTYRPESHYEPSAVDLAEMAAWSQSVDDHDEAMATWMDFFGDAEEKSTYFIS